MIGVDLDVYEEVCKERDKLEEQLTEAKKIIKALYDIIPASMADYAKEQVRSQMMAELGDAMQTWR